jgi:hypothetical protein
MTCEYVHNPLETHYDYEPQVSHQGSTLVTLLLPPHTIDNPISIQVGYHSLNINTQIFLNQKNN